MIRTLIVDDEHLVRKGIISSIQWEQLGLQIVGEASNGIKALEFIQDSEIDLLITDLSMPVMNGFDLMKQVRDHYPMIQIAILTCHEDFKYIQEALRLGAVDYIVKTELENDSMIDSFKRLVSRISTGGQVGRINQIKDEPEYVWTSQLENELRIILDQWIPLQWVLNEQHFERLLEQMRVLHPPISKVSIMFHVLLHEWSYVLEGDWVSAQALELEKLTTWNQWEPFVRQLRTQLKTRSQSYKYPPDIVLRIFEAVEWLQKEVGSDITQRVVAQRLKMNRGYFSECFKDIIGTTFSDYVHNLRMQKAQNLLIHTRKSVYEIAEECGFQDQRYFSRVFRDKTGALPSEYRNRVT